MYYEAKGPKSFSYLFHTTQIRFLESGKSFLTLILVKNSENIVWFPS